MALSYLHLLLLCSFWINVTSVTCPTKIITNDGTFPESFTELIPKTFDCKMEFQIRPGHVLQLNASISNRKSFLTVSDALDKSTIIKGPEQTVVLPARNATVTIKTTNNDTAIFLSWKFIQVFTHNHHIKSLGTQHLFDIPSFESFVFSSTDQGPVVFQTVSLSDSDFLNQISVYDGDNTFGAYLGSLSSYKHKLLKSSGRSLTFVNFGETIVNSNFHGVANNFNAISAYSSYKIANSDDGDTVINENAAVTFLCRWEKCYIDKVIADAKVLIEIRPRTPSDGKEALITFRGQNFNGHLPQEIYSDLFTVVVTGGMVVLRVTTAHTFWNVAYAGRQGSILSPSAWNSNLDPTYSMELKTFQQCFIFKLNLSHLEVRKHESGLKLTISSPMSDPKELTIEKHHKLLPELELYGSSVKIDFIGKSQSSWFKLNFEILGNGTCEKIVLTNPPPIFFNSSVLPETGTTPVLSIAHESAPALLKSCTKFSKLFQVLTICLLSTLFCK